DPLAATRARRLPDAVLWSPEGRRDGGGGHAGRRGVAAETGRGVDLQSGRSGDLGKRAAVLELLHHLGRFRPQLARDLVFAPFRLDLAANLVERALARGRNAQHVVPDIAAGKLDRFIVHADVAVEGLRNHVKAARNVGDGLAIGQAAGAIDSVDRDGGQAELLRSLDHVGAAAALVFHLVLDFV